MGPNGIPLFCCFLKFTNKKVFFCGINVPFRCGINVPPAYLYRPRNGINMPPLKKTGEKGSKHYYYDGKIRQKTHCRIDGMLQQIENSCCCCGDVGEQKTDTVATMVEEDRKQLLLLRWQRRIENRCCCYDGKGGQKTATIATMVEKDRKQMLLLW